MYFGTFWLAPSDIEIENYIEDAAEEIGRGKIGVTNIDPENYFGDKAEEMVKSFKEEGGSEEVTAEKEKLWGNGYLLASEPWSDRLACQGHGLVKGIQLKMYDFRISEIRFRQGNSWQPWRSEEDWGQRGGLSRGGF